MPASFFVPEPGEVIAGRYHLDALLGVGAAGEVLRATDRSTGGPVAVKFIRGLDASMDERFPTEVQVLQRLHHPGIVGLLDHGHHHDMPYLVMEFVDGRSLAKRLLDGPLDLPRVTRMGAQVAAALSHAHHHGVIHRDVKPGNVLLSRDGHARLADFGIARIAGRSVHTRTGEVLGSAVYLSPEQARGERVGPPADVFSLGLVLAEAALGDLGIEARPAEVVIQRATGLVPDWSRLPSSIRDLVEAMTSPEAPGRPSAADVAGALAAFGPTPVQIAGPPAPVSEQAVDLDPNTHPTSRSDGIGAPAPRTTGRDSSGDLAPREPAPRYLIWAAAAVIAVLLVLAGLALGAGGDDDPPDPPPETVEPTGPPPTDPGP